MPSRTMRVGIGHDIHRLAAGMKLVIGGVTVPHTRGALGHSDADVLLHAVTDALLGAAGLGDIGEWFPDADPQWSAVDSSLFVTRTLQAVRERGFRVVNLDCTVFAQLPKLSGFKQQMAQRLAELLEISVDAVNVKAKTGERVGPVGRQEAIAADAVVLLCADEPN